MIMSINTTIPFTSTATCCYPCVLIESAEAPRAIHGRREVQPGILGDLDAEATMDMDPLDEASNE